MAKPVTLSDVAREAGVDLSTASRALRGEGRVSEATRERILGAARRLDFRPNAQAQFLANGISKTVGVLTLNALGTFTLPVMAGVNQALGMQDIATLFYDVHYDEALLAESVRKLQARRVDGLLMLGDGLQTPLHSVGKSFDRPVVYAFASTDSPDDTWFMPDGEMAGRLAAEHLIGLGRTRIAHITARDDVAARQREAGLLAVLREHGLALALGRPMLGDWSRQWGAEAAGRLLDPGVEVDAVFCGNDQIALGVYGVLRAAGVRIPDDVALIGVDNWEGMVGSGGNLLTTIDPRLNAVGVAAARALTEATDGVHEPGPHYEPCALILGETTMGSGPRASADPEGLI